MTIRHLALALILLSPALSCPARAQTAVPEVSTEARALYEERTITHEGIVYSFRVLAPPEIRPGARYPLLYFLHGAGERGTDNVQSLRYLPDQMARSPYRRQFQGYVIVPQCRDGQRWVEADWGAGESSRMRAKPSLMMNLAMAILDRSLKEYPIDLNRVYLAGISMGGYGAWELAARRPETFAAVVPICGGGDEKTARLLAGTAVWAWHGVEDEVVLPQRSRRMVEAIRAAGGVPRYSELPGVGHTVFLNAFASDSGLLTWIAAQHRGPARTDDGPGRLRILCAGDSNTEAREFPGYRAYLKQEADRRGIAIDFVGAKSGGEPASDSEHEGYSGEGIARIRQRVREGMIEQLAPDYVLLLVGSNDLWKDVRRDRSPVSPERARELGREANELMAEMLRRRPSLRILIGLPATPGNTPEALAIYRDALRGAPQHLVKVATVDMEGLENDGVHYADAGFRGMARRWADAIAAGRPKAPPIGSALPPHAVTIAGPSAPTPVFGTAEVRIQVDRPTALNPFTDVAVRCDFTGPDGVERHTEGFADTPDGSLFLARMMPLREGEYHWRVTYRQDEFEKTAAGSFRASAGAANGPVRVDPKNPAHFLYEGSGAHYFWNSTTAYGMAGWRDDGIIRETIDRLASQHVNRARVGIMMARVNGGEQWKEPAIVNDGLFSFCVNPWPASYPDDVNEPGFNPHRFNVEYWRRFDRLLVYAREKGVQISVVFYVDGALPAVDPFRSPAMGGDLEQMFYRYAVARLAAFSNVMWDITNEYRHFRDDAWAAKMGSLIRAADPYGHLMSIHGHGDFRFRSAPWVDFAMYQSWDEHGGYAYMTRNREEQASTGRPMPQVLEEYGYEDHYPFPWGEGRVWPARTADTRRRIAWQVTMAGGYQTTGERANVAGYGGWINGRGSADMTMLRDYAILHEFWTAREWWKMRPVAGVATEGVPVLALEEREYVMYVEQGSALDLNLPGTGYRADWFDPRTGHQTSAGPVRQAKWRSSSPPGAGDWVLVIRRQ